MYASSKILTKLRSLPYIFFWQIFCTDLTRDKHWEIMEDIVEIYNTEAEIDETEEWQDIDLLPSV